MTYCKFLDNDYILAIGTGNGGEEITKSEYDTILSVIQLRPQETETVGYRLKADLTWESYEKEPTPLPDEISDSEAMEILLGGVSE